VFPYSSRRAGHHVERPGFGIDREAIPGLSGPSAESKLASGSERQTEYLVELRLVAVPADANSHAIFGTENLLNAGCPASVSLHVCNDFRQPAGDRFSALQLAQVVVVAEAEHGHPPFPFKLFVVSAGVFRFSLTRFTLAVIAGRLFRFLLEGYFTILYGAQAKQVLQKYYPWIGLGLAILIIVFFVARNLLKGKPEPAEEASLEPGN